MTIALGTLSLVKQAAAAAVFARGSEVEIAEDFLDRLKKAGGGPVVSAHGGLHQYNNETGSWDPLPAELAQGAVHGYDRAWIQIEDAKGKVHNKPMRLSSRQVEGVYRCALRDTETLRPEFFAEAPVGVLLANGFVTVSAEGIEVKPHSPDNRARYPLRYAYDDNIEVGPWNDFMRNLFLGDDDAQEKTQALQEFVGASLVGLATQYARCMVLTGTGSNGKSTFIELVQRLFHPATVTSVAPHDWGNEYYRVRLVDSKINTTNELPETEIMSSEAFKAVITGESVMGRDLYRSPFSFVPKGGHLFACNALPGTRDHSAGFWRRFMVVEFCRNFELAERKQTKAEVVEEMTPHLPAALQWALHGAVRLIRRSKYTEPKSHQAAIVRWQIESNSVAAWLDEERLVKATHEGQWAKASTAYANYRDWCNKNNMRPVNSKNFCNRLKDQGIERKRVGSGSFYSLTGAEEN